MPVEEPNILRVGTFNQTPQTRGYKSVATRLGTVRMSSKWQ